MMLLSLVQSMLPQPVLPAVLGNTGNVVYHALHDQHGDGIQSLSTNDALNRFLSGVERRAFRMAELATSNSDAALDIVQEAMLALVKRYRNSPEGEWGPLFHRILQSKIRDWYRRSSVRHRIMGWLHIDEDEDIDPIQLAADNKGIDPEQALSRERDAASTLEAIRKLPLRQQQTFLLRAWEGYSVNEAASAMGCSEGSIKTHYARAIATLKTSLQDYNYASE